MQIFARYVSMLWVQFGLEFVYDDDLRLRYKLVTVTLKSTQLQQQEQQQWLPQHLLQEKIQGQQLCQQEDSLLLQV